jgi:exopolysaccharide production protein ExoZ
MTQPQRVGNARFSPSLAVGTHRPKQLGLIQSLRGAAALLVVLYHASALFKRQTGAPFLWDTFSYGFSGVDFFFVLSGFIILHAHRKDLGRSDRLQGFLVRRGVRVFPTYWAAFFPCLLAVLALPQLGTQGNERELGTIIRSILLLPQEAPTVLGVAWTLSHELFFYVCFGLLAFTAAHRRARTLATAWVLCSMFVWGAELSLGKDALPYAVRFVFSGYNLEFAAGCLAALLAARVRRAFGWSALLVGVMVFVATSVLMIRGIAQFDRIVAFGGPCSFIILGAAVLDLTSERSLPRVALFLGDASYSLYLIHYPALVLFVKGAAVLGLFDRLGAFPTCILIVAATVAAGCIFFVLIEKPILRWVRAALHGRLAGRNGCGSAPERWVS